MPKLFRWFGRLRPRQPTPDDADELPWRDRVDHVRSLMDAFAPPPPMPKGAEKPAPEDLPTDSPENRNP